MKTKEQKIHELVIKLKRIGKRFTSSKLNSIMCSNYLKGAVINSVFVKSPNGKKYIYGNGYSSNEETAKAIVEFGMEVGRQYISGKKPNPSTHNKSSELKTREQFIAQRMIDIAIAIKSKCDIVQPIPVEWVDEWNDFYKQNRV